MHIVDNYLSGTGCYAISAKMVDSHVYGVLTYDGVITSKWVINMLMQVLEL